MTATDPAVTEAAARVWALIAHRRDDAPADEPGLPLGIALDMMTDSGCERDAAFLALRAAARDALTATAMKLPGGVYANPELWAVYARGALHMIGAQSVKYAHYQLERAERELVNLGNIQARRRGLGVVQLRSRYAWRIWALDARCAVDWLQQLASMCEG
jgi:hypothetical protein